MKFFVKSLAMLVVSFVLLAAFAGCAGTTSPVVSRYLYIADDQSAQISSFQVSGTTLVPVTGSPFAIGGGNPIGLATVSNSLYAGLPSTSTAGSGGLFQFSVANGQLSAGPTYLVGDDIVALTPDPAGNFLYVPDAVHNQIHSFKIDQTSGNLTEVFPGTSTTPLATGDAPVAVQVDPAGKFVLTANLGSTSLVGSVSVFSINADGTLTTVGAGPFRIGAGNAIPSGLAVSPDSKTLYIASNDGNVYMDTINPDGSLSNDTPFAAGQGTQDVAITSDGKFVYATNAPVDSTGNAVPGSISQFSVGAGGALTKIGADAPAGKFPAFIVVDSKQGLTYVANDTDSTISIYTIGTDGKLTQSTSPVATGGFGAATLVFNK